MVLVFGLYAAREIAEEVEEENLRTQYVSLN